LLVAKAKNRSLGAGRTPGQATVAIDGKQWSIKSVRLTQVIIIRLRQILSSTSLREFFRGFLSTEKWLALTLKDTCHACPASSRRAGRYDSVPQDDEKIEECRKRYFAALLQSYLGKPGDQETDWLYSYLRRCEECSFHRFAGGEPVVFGRQ
jgi:hypothetical protein